MKIAVVNMIIVAFILYFLYNDSIVTGKSMEGTALLKVMSKYLKQRGIISCNADRYVVQLNAKFATYVKSLAKGQNSELLKGWSEKDVDGIMLELSKKKTTAYYAISIKVTGQNLLSENDWEVENLDSQPRKMVIVHGEDKVMSAKRPILSSKKYGISIEFFLGLETEYGKEISLKHFGLYMKYPYRNGVLMDPTLEIAMKKTSSSYLKYIIFLHIDGDDHIHKRNPKAFLLIRAVALSIAASEYKDSNFPKALFELDYQRLQGVAGISFKDDSIGQFLARWIKVTGPNSILVNLYPAVKMFIRNPSTWISYQKISDIPHNLHGSEVDDKGHLLLLVDKHQKGLSPYSKSENFQEVYNPDSKFETTFDKSLDVIKLMASNELDEKALPRMKENVLKLLKSDAKEHWKNFMVNRNFRPVDQHFSFRKDSAAQNPFYVIIDDITKEDCTVTTEEICEVTTEEICEVTTEEICEVTTEVCIETTEEICETTEEICETTTEELCETTTEEICEETTEEICVETTEEICEVTTEVCEETTEEICEITTEVCEETTEEICEITTEEICEETTEEICEITTEVCEETTEEICVITTEEICNETTKKICG